MNRTGSTFGSWGGDLETCKNNSRKNMETKNQQPDIVMGGDIKMDLNK
jgi:hypothetical protein